MAAANASARGQRHAIVASPLRELTGFVLVVDCGGAQCGGERSYALTALATCYAQGMTVSGALRQMRCARGCGGRPAAAWLGRPGAPTLNERSGGAGWRCWGRRRGSDAPHEPGDFSSINYRSG
jgi:hypothetical protein